MGGGIISALTSGQRVITGENIWEDYEKELLNKFYSELAYENWSDEKKRCAKKLWNDLYVKGNYDPVFAAGLIGNMFGEGSCGVLQSGDWSNYVDGNGQALCVGIEKITNIYQTRVACASESPLGVGMVQWSQSVRKARLLKNYESVKSSDNSLATEQLVEAECRTIIEELELKDASKGGFYTYIFPSYEEIEPTLINLKEKLSFSTCLIYREYERPYYKTNVNKSDYSVIEGLWERALKAESITSEEYSICSRIIAAKVIYEEFMGVKFMKKRVMCITVILFILFISIVLIKQENKSNRYIGHIITEKNTNLSKDKIKDEKNDLYSFASDREVNITIISQEDVYKLGKSQAIKKLTFFIDDETINLSSLSNLNELEELTIYSVRCENLNTTPLGELKQLKKVYLMRDCMYDISFLAELDQVEEILIDGEIDDLSVFENISELKSIYVECVSDADLSYLQKLNKLEKIHIVGSGMKNFEGLEDLINVTEVFLFDNSLGEKTQVLDMNVFTKMKELDEILLSHLNIVDIAPLSENKHLEVITLVHTNVTDIRPLENLESLKILNIFENESLEVEEQAEKYFTDVETNIYKQVPYPY